MFLFDKKFFEEKCMINSNAVKFSLAAFGCGIFLAACGDDVTKVTNSGLDVVASADSLGKCTGERFGEMMFAQKENAVFVCADSAWQNVSAAGDSSDGKACAVEMLADSSGYKVVCGGDSVGVILDGLASEGCSIADDGMGTVTQVCGEDTVTFNKGLCGSSPYEPLKGFCFEDSVYSCEGKPYDPSKKFCYEKAVYALCDGKPYDPTDSVWKCIDGRIAMEFTDERDGQTYAAVKIGEQLWMAENLNFAYPKLTISGSEEDSTESAALDSISFCYNNDPVNCEKYGRLYTWAAAMDSLAVLGDSAGFGCGYGVDCSPTYPVRGICPEGWHLPDTAEWFALRNFIEKQLGDTALVGYALKSTSEWISNGIGSDMFGFKALPAGYLNVRDLKFSDIQQNAYFWSSVARDDEDGFFTNLEYDYPDFDVWRDFKYAAYSVRCIKD